MPTYEYECKACGHNFDFFQSMKDEPLKKCPECGKNELKRLLGTGAGIIFKGSGFYETDYKRGNSYQKAAEKEKPASSTSKSASSSSSKKKSDSGKSNSSSSS